MKTHTKIFIDRLVGLPLAWLLNLSARVLGKVLNRDHSSTRASVRTIVISKYLGMAASSRRRP